MAAPGAAPAESVEFDPREALEALDDADRAGVLRVHVSHAVGLKAADLNGMSDPYMKVHLCGEQQKTQVVKKTLHPRFKTDLCFAVPDLAAIVDERLSIEAFDYDMVGAHDLLGKASVELQAHLGALLSGERVEWAPCDSVPRRFAACARGECGSQSSVARRDACDLQRISAPSASCASGAASPTSAPAKRARAAQIRENMASSP